MKWLDATEVNAGLVWNERISLEDTDPNDYHDPYNDIIRKLQKGTDKDTLVGDYLEQIQTAMHAADRVNGLGDSNWNKILIQSKQAHEEGIFLERAGRRRQDGKEIDLDFLEKILEGRSQVGPNGFKKLDEIEEVESIYQKTGFHPFDQHFGGLPIGMTIMSGRPKVGKTSLAIIIAISMILKHKKYVTFFTLENKAEQLKKRIQQILSIYKNKDEIYSKVIPFLLIDDGIHSPKEIRLTAKEAEKHYGEVCLSVVDFIDWALEKEVSESVMGNAFLNMTKLAKEINAPNLVLAQMSRKQGIPRPTHVRWSGLAEALCHLNVMLYNPVTDYTVDHDQDSFFADSNPLPPLANKAYAIGWLARGGFEGHPTDAPGAIQIPFSPIKGWKNSKKTEWNSLQNLI